MVSKKFEYLCIVVGVLAVSCLLYLMVGTDGNMPVDLEYQDYSVKILFNENHVPTISSQSDLGVFYGMGYTHARDRLWQLNLFRGLAAGKLSETFGKDTVELDKVMRNFAFETAAAAALKSMDQEALDYLKAYAKGINDYASSLTWLPTEFILLGAKFAPWTIMDTVIITSFTGFQVAHHWFYTIIRSYLAANKGQHIADIFYNLDETTNFFRTFHTIVSEGQVKINGLTEKEKPAQVNIKKIIEQYAVLEKEAKPTKAAPGKFDDLEIGKGLSNAFAIHGKHTKSGKPLLASDPHLFASMPTIWYLSILKFKDTTVSGSIFPGSPGVSFGRNDYFAWGMTTSMIENCDIYALKLDKELKHYFHDGKWKDLTIKESVIRVKGGEEIPYNTYATHHGAVLFPISKEQVKSLPPLFHALGFLSQPVALAWYGYSGDRIIVGGVRLNKAKSLEEIMNAASMLDSSANSVTFATVDGHIGNVVSGKIPKRDNIVISSYIRDGTDKKQDWNGFVPTEEMPRSIDPEEGYIVACNNKLAPMTMKGGLGTTGLITGRSLRAVEFIKSKIQKKELFDEQTMMQMQMDTIDVYARELVPLIVELAAKHKGGVALSNQKESMEKVEDIIEILAKWDFDESSYSKGALVYNVWETEFKKSMFQETFTDEFERGFLLGVYGYIHAQGNLIREWNDGRNLNSKHCANKHPEVKGSQAGVCVENLLESFVATHDYITANLGENKVNWQWGNLMSLVHPHMPFSRIILKPLFQKERRGLGNMNTLNVGKFKQVGNRYESPFYGLNRIVVSLSSKSRMHYCYGAGQSESFLSRYYFDGSEKHFEGHYDLIE